MSLPTHAKSVIYLSFLDEADRNVEYSHWQYWYELQANPNQKAFDIGTLHIVLYHSMICIHCMSIFGYPDITHFFPLF